jgi:hypothetical protein
MALKHWEEFIMRIYVTAMIDLFNPDSGLPVTILCNLAGLGLGYSRPWVS